MARLILFLMLLVLKSEENDGACELGIHRRPNGNIILQENCRCGNSSTCGEIKSGQYVCKDKYEKYRHWAMGVSTLACLMFILLVVAIVGWIVTCCLMYKTTEFSIKPKRIAATQNQYTDAGTSLQSINTTSFQPSTGYSLLGSGCENPSKTEGVPTTDQEGIYEVLDGNENGPVMKGPPNKDERRMLISEEQSGLYNKLKFEDLS